MKTKPIPNKYICIHAHFYQPPRENPWTNEVDFQPSAYPYNDWNQKIARESYIPNLYARIKDEQNRPLEAINNCEFLNFNFGPTLLGWIEKEYPYYHKKIVETARVTRQKSGHSNAIAQIYNHIIMPLAAFNDQVTQLLWGIEDFKYRFGFEPESIWLPETAASPDTLKILIDRGIKYIILSPHQAEKSRLIDAKKWTNVSSGNIDPKKPYLWYDKDDDGNKIKNRKIAVFFYDAPLSKAVAFEDILNNSSSLADRALACYNNKSHEDQILLIASDGETYGHHQKFGDMTLAHAFKHEFEKRSIKNINLGSYLKNHPPKHEIEIKKGPDGDGTSWSCAHGIRRWKGGCDCGKEGHGTLDWRKPLRNALNNLRNTLSDIYEKEGEKLFKNIWRARNEYIKPLLSHDKKTFEDFISANMREGLSEENKSKALNLLEMQKYAMYMFTSCGWFFSDISRIEAVQNLKYAAMAIDVAKKLGFDGIEKEFADILALAPSNNHNIKTGDKAYKKLAIADKLPLKLILCGHLIELFHFSETGNSKYFYEINVEQMKTEDFDKSKLISGIIKSKNTFTLENHKHAFAYFSEKKEMPIIHISRDNPRGKLDFLQKTFSSIKEMKREKIITEIEKTINEKAVRFEDFPFNEKTIIIKKIVRTIRLANKQESFKIFKSYSGLFEKNKDLGSVLFSGLKSEINSYAKETLEILIAEYIKTKSPDTLNELRQTAEKIHRYKLKPHANGQQSALIKEISKDYSDIKDMNEETIKPLREMAQIAKYLNYDDVLFHIQNILSDSLPETLNTVNCFDRTAD